MSVRRYCFGLYVESSLDFPGPDRARSRRAPGDVRVERVACGRIDDEWPADGGELLMERRRPSGERYLAVERAEEGYRIAAPRYGTYFVTPDGRRILASVPAEGWQWQRLFFAQVLPLASALQGLALFHAGAIGWEGRAFGFVASSGTGKSSLTAHLMTLGAAFVTDDVLSLETGRSEVLAHPGAPMLAVHPDEVAAMSAHGRARLGDEIGAAGKTYHRVPPVEGPVPLEGLFYLKRGPSISAFEVTELAPTPAIVLASGFLTYLTAPEHLRGHLDASARISTRVPLYELRIPPGVESKEVARRMAGFLSDTAARV